MKTADYIALADWRRRIAEMYSSVRHSTDPADAWMKWRAERDELFRSHTQSPLKRDSKGDFKGLEYFPYDAGLRTATRLSQVKRPESIQLPSSGDRPLSFTHFATASFVLRGETLELGVYWLEEYSGGIFVPFSDSTSGTSTYGAGRYLIDTAKGADPGTNESGELILDFNFAYNPSCAYDDRWTCPLAPPKNRLTVPIEAGERV